MKTLTTILVIAVAFLLPLANLQAATWNVPGDFATIQVALDSPEVIPGDTIMVGPGQHAGATITKAVEIRGEGGATIVDGPLLAPYPYACGFFFPGQGAGSGATISHLKFETVEFPVMSRGADNVTVSQCSLVDSLQGISNWGGSGWEISHNEITDLRCNNGGGIAVLVGARFGEMIVDNVVSHNKISGTLHVPPPYDEGGTEKGGYEGSGIVLYADFRYGWPGAAEISCNRVVKNKVSLVSDNASLVDVCAFELSEVYLPAQHPGESSIVTTENTVGFNDFRGTLNQIVLSPEILADYNSISRNLGKNRGQGLPPSVFGPGGN
ncbi:MAG: right-handed parallel beta-helix repeat-containing protein [Phycisphaerales bacterium]|nr:MAG: right-handed parallel beta-helix repeat-containing protein [Phycisphaerales bacterium]